MSRTDQKPIIVTPFVSDAKSWELSKQYNKIANLSIILKTWQIIFVHVEALFEGSLSEQNIVDWHVKAHLWDHPIEFRYACDGNFADSVPVISCSL